MAHQRCITGGALCGPFITADLPSDTFFAQTGKPFSASAPPADDNYAGWSFGFYAVNTNPTGSPAWSELTVTGPGGLNYSSTIFPLGALSENSFNIGMPFIGGNADLAGLYTITLAAYGDQAGPVPPRSVEDFRERPRADHPRPARPRPGRPRAPRPQDPVSAA